MKSKLKYNTIEVFEQIKEEEDLERAKIEAKEEARNMIARNLVKQKNSFVIFIDPFEYRPMPIGKGDKCSTF